ncbi:MAG: endolytic transglycosylase MltG, partial [Nitrospirales bacterium]
PNTYQFTRTQSLEEMAAEMVHQFRQVAQQMGLNSDVHRTVTLASIVEKETAVAEERPLVASVYSNRLTKKIALDADPSVIYALLQAGAYTGSLHHADLAVRSPYNTYRYPGLPPGPIGNPGRDSLAAALHPASTQFLYFVSDGNGHHRFARNLEEHNRNVAAYRHALGLR